MKISRVIASVLLLLAAFSTPLLQNILALSGVVAGGFILHAWILRSIHKAARRSIPVLLFACLLSLLQLVSAQTLTGLPLKVCGVFFLSTAAFHLFPWRYAASAARPGSHAFALVLFFLLIGHFVGIMGAETRRVFAARSMCVSNPYGRGWFRSLAWALAGIFQRSLVRAERLYASLWLRGLSQ